MQIVNIAAYRFVPIEAPQRLRLPLRDLCTALQLKGTILLAQEGINLFLAGQADAIDGFLQRLDEDPLFSPLFQGLPVKRSASSNQPFRRMLVRLKKEIITMRHPAIAPAQGRAPAVLATTLRRWLDQGADDDGRDIVLLDTRNRFEVALGSFQGALDLGIARFGDFPAAFKSAVENHQIDLDTQRIVTFCTGGIRCEKAALYLAEQGATAVTQLDGGILKYFEDVGAAHWSGECFVFDDRVALDAQLNPTATVQCYNCRAVVTTNDQRDPRYRLGESCPQCATQPALMAAE